MVVVAVVQRKVQEIDGKAVMVFQSELSVQRRNIPTSNIGTSAYVITKIEVTLVHCSEGIDNQLAYRSNNTR